MPSKPEAFLSEAQLIARSSAATGRRLDQWKHSIAGVARLPETLLLYTFDDTAVSERSVVNLAGHSGTRLDGNIVSCELTKGRWPGKSALKFGNESDRVRLLVDAPLKAITLVAWVRVDALPRHQNALLSSDSEQPGSIRWHITKAGELRLEIARDLGRPRSDWEAVNSKPFFAPEQLGQWVMLATTFDGRVVSHYANGELIGTGPSFRPDSILIGSAELGNWRGLAQRQLAAAMDEFAIYSTALRPEQIATLYHAGR